MKNSFVIFATLILWFANCFMSTLSASAIAVGGGAGGDFPFAHSDTTESGVAAEGFYRIDPYEIRFHFGDLNVKTYSVVVAMKHFFSNTIARPYIEAALGPTIVNTSGRGMAYGARPEASIGVDIGINQHFSAGVVTRYFGLVYFGNTSSGKFEANHGLSLLGNLIVWF
jgi:hypothetical protein